MSPDLNDIREIKREMAGTNDSIGGPTRMEALQQERDRLAEELEEAKRLLIRWKNYSGWYEDADDLRDETGAFLWDTRAKAPSR